MNCLRLVTTGLAAMVLAAPAVAEPGYFQVPGTETSVRLSATMILDATYDFVNASGPLGGLGTGYWYNGSLTPDVAAPKKQWDMTAARSRFGFDSKTPSDLGLVKVRFEGDFAPSPVDNNAATNSSIGHNYFNIRHAYGEIGGLLAGQTWSTFVDVAARPEALDWDGLIADYYAGSRLPQIRYTFTLDPQSTLAVALERSEVPIFGTSGYSEAKAFPGSVVGAYNYQGAWGHVMAAVAFQKYSETLYADPTGANPSLSKTTLSWSLSGNARVGQDNLVAHVGVGNGFYGPWMEDGVFERDNGTTPTSLYVIQALQYEAGYTHVWSSRFRSNAFLSEAVYSENASEGMDGAAFKRFAQYGVNTIAKLAKNVQLGVEYLYGRAYTFDSDATLLTAFPGQNKVSESKLRFQLKFNLY
jgi:hypothetical protein